MSDVDLIEQHYKGSKVAGCTAQQGVKFKLLPFNFGHVDVYVEPMPILGLSSEYMVRLSIELSNPGSTTVVMRVVRQTLAARLIDPDSLYTEIDKAMADCIRHIMGIHQAANSGSTLNPSAIP